MDIFIRQQLHFLITNGSRETAGDSDIDSNANSCTDTEFDCAAGSSKECCVEKDYDYMHQGKLKQEGSCSETGMP